MLLGLIATVVSRLRLFGIERILGFVLIVVCLDLFCCDLLLPCKLIILVLVRFVDLEWFACLFDCLDLLAML